MTAVAEKTQVTISLETGCDFSECAQFAFPLHKQLSSGAYTWPCSVLSLPVSAAEWSGEHRTARKRAARCEADGYRFAEIRREQYELDVYEVNMSATHRQGRPMTAPYRQVPQFKPLPDYPCARHAVRTYGVLDEDDRLRAYTWVYRAGDLVMFSSILGHAEHLERHVMYLLFRGALEAQIVAGPGFAFYNMHNGGTPGLVFYKVRCGFRPAEVEWAL